MGEPAATRHASYHGPLDDAFITGTSFSDKPILLIDTGASPQALAALQRTRTHSAMQLMRFLTHDRANDATGDLLDILYPVVAELDRLADTLYERLRVDEKPT